MLAAGRAVVEELGEARVGDKTLLDTLVPASEAYLRALDAGDSFTDALAVMAEAAERGKESTRDLVARVGRASRLGERSRVSSTREPRPAGSCCVPWQTRCRRYW